MIEAATQALSKISKRMLDNLARAVRDDPTPSTAARVLESYRQPWADLFAYVRLASVADGMVDAWDQLPFDLTEEDQRSILQEAKVLSVLSPDDMAGALSGLDPQEQILIAPFLGLPPMDPPKELDLPDDDMFRVKVPAYEWALKDLAERRLVTREEWDRLEAEQREEAFTVAGLQTEAALARVQEALGETLSEGWTLEEFKAACAPQTFLSENHAETVFRTNLHSLYSDGKMAIVEHPMVQDAFPYATIDPIGDDRVRKSHLLLRHSGLNSTNIYRIDDPVFKTFRPPFDFNCRCSWGPLTVRQAADRGVLEAKLWLERGTPPSDPQHVPWPIYQGAPLMPNPRYMRSD